MGLKSFLKLVEIKTKAASMTPFLLGTVFVLYRYQKFNWVNFLLMLVSLLCFDMATTAINNYLDYKKQEKPKVSAMRSITPLSGTIYRSFPFLRS